MHTCNPELGTMKYRFGHNLLCRGQYYFIVHSSHQPWGSWYLHLWLVVNIECQDKQKRVFLLFSELQCTFSGIGDGKYACTFKGWKDHLCCLNSDQKVPYISSISTRGLDPCFWKTELHARLPFIAILSIQDSTSQDFLPIEPSSIPL